MLLRKINFIFLFTLLCMTPLLFGEQDEHTVDQVTITNTSWTNPSDGSFPTLTDWKLRIVLDDEREFVTTYQYNPSHASIHGTIKVGDKVRITKEAFNYGNPDQSWFHMEIQSNGKEIDFEGKAFQEKPDISMYHADDIFKIRDLLMKKERDQWLLSFYVKNIHTTIQVPSERYQDYYEGLPLVFLEQESEELLENGKFRLILSFFHPVLMQPITLISDLMGGPVELKIIKSESSEYVFHWEENRQATGPSRNVPYLQTWTTTLLLEDGEELILKGQATSIHELKYQNKWGGIKDPISEDVAARYKVGDKVLISKESESENADHRKNHIGDFTVINLSNQRSDVMQGILRHSVALEDN